MHTALCKKEFSMKTKWEKVVARKERNRKRDVADLRDGALVRALVRMIAMSKHSTVFEGCSNGADPTGYTKMEAYAFMPYGFGKTDTLVGCPDSQFVKINVLSIWGYDFQVVDAVTGEPICNAYYDNEWFPRKTANAPNACLARLFNEAEFCTKEYSVQCMENVWEMDDDTEQNF
jgi:hypothetical protein